MEIRKKGLPKNTPTLIQRLQREQGHNPIAIPNRRGGYHKGLTGTWADNVDPEATTKELVKESIASLKTETKKLISEFPTDMAFLDLPKNGEERVAFEFDTEAKRDDWIVTCDSTWGEGYSSASFGESTNCKGKGLFSGELVTRPPNDGRVANAGYANIRSVYRTKSFGRIDTLDWIEFTHLILRVRGDGRTYMVNLYYHDEWDYMWHDLHQFPLHTRGGPYWQTTVIPFSKFILTYASRLQDFLERVRPHDIVALGITLADGNDGPFSLEVDSVKVRCERSTADDKVAYETYMFPRNRYHRP